MGPSKQVSRVLIADESVLFRRGLSALLSSDPCLRVIGQASTRKQLLKQIQELKPDVLVIDSALLLASGKPSLGLTIRQIQQDLAILVLAHQDTEETMNAAMNCGAKGFSLKSSPAKRLMEAARKVAFEEGGLNHSGLLPDLQALATQTSHYPKHSVLTSREQEVVCLLAEGKTVRVVARELSLSMKTVEAHKLNLMRKLDIHDRASLIHYATRLGMIAEATAGKSVVSQ